MDEGADAARYWREAACCARLRDHEELVKDDFKCTAVPLSVAPDNFYIDVWNSWIPELDINSALPWHGSEWIVNWR